MKLKSSGWVIEKINYSLMNFVKYKSFAGASYIELLDWVKNKKCGIIVKNEKNNKFKIKLEFKIIPEIVIVPSMSEITTFVFLDQKKMLPITS